LLEAVGSLPTTIGDVMVPFSTSKMIRFAPDGGTIRLRKGLNMLELVGKAKITQAVIAPNPQLVTAKTWIGWALSLLLGISLSRRALVYRWTVLFSIIGYALIKA
jgi:hypothetical protein